MKLRQIIIICFLGSSTFTSGQNIALSFSSNNISLADTIAMGDTIWYNFWIVNDGNSVITDYIALKTARFCQAQGMINEREIGHVNPGALFPSFTTQKLYQIVSPKAMVSVREILFEEKERAIF